MRAFVVALVGLLVVGVSGASAAERKVSTKYNAYSPHHVIALTGETVRWKNNETPGPNRDHSVTPDDGGFPPSGTIVPGDEFTNVFNSVGTFSYKCSFHLFMRGAVGVYDLYFKGPPSSVLYGKTAAMSGYAPEGSPVDIFLQEDATPVMNVTSNPTSGYFTASLPAVPGRYKAVSGLRESAFVRVSVRPKLSVRSRHKGKAFWITGSAAPNQTGGTMVLERKSGSSWKKLGTRTLPASSKAVFKVVPKAKMQVRLRLSAPVNGYAKSTSGTLTLRP